MPNAEADPRLETLHHGTIASRGKFLWGSNYTMLVEVQHGELGFPAVYKPTTGERPLWDFPSATLAAREVAAFLVSESLGWGMVPPTVYREEAPRGPGSLQMYIEHDPEYHYFRFTPEHLARLRPVAAFDLLINNADRKGSHILIDPEDRMWLIDHGICFHAQNKLRTVIWDFAGERIPDGICRDLAAFQNTLCSPSPLRERLEALLSPREVRALERRAELLLADGRFPDPSATYRPYPWPPV